MSVVMSFTVHEVEHVSIRCCRAHRHRRHTAPTLSRVRECRASHHARVSNPTTNARQASDRAVRRLGTLRDGGGARQRRGGGERVAGEGAGDPTAIPRTARVQASRSSLSALRSLIDRTRIRGERAAASRKRARRTGAAATVARLRRGEEPDDNGNWAVRRIVEVIRFKGRGSRVDVKVEWEGVDEQGR
eukprot:3310473-Prymnesium_polylepis.2